MKTLQERMLDEFVKEHIPVTLHMMNGEEILGTLLAYDDTVLAFAEHGRNRIIYKHALSGIDPIKSLKSISEEQL